MDLATQEVKSIGPNAIDLFKQFKLEITGIHLLSLRESDHGQRRRTEDP